MTSGGIEGLGAAQIATAAGTDRNALDVDDPGAGTFAGRAVGTEDPEESVGDPDTDTPDTPADDAVASGADADATSSS